MSLLRRPPSNATKRDRCGFTLVELLVVIAIIGVLIALLMPAVQATREAARRTSCINNLHQLAIAVQNYSDAKKAMPPSGLVDGAGATYGAFYGNTGKMLSWVVLILPYTEEKNISERFDMKRTALDQPNEPQATPLPVMQCPSDAARNRFFVHGTLTKNKRFAKGNYAAYVGPYHIENQNWFSGAIIGRKQRMKDILDGTAKTIMLSEVRTRAWEPDPRGAWALPWAGSSLLSFDGHTDPDGIPAVGSRPSKYRFNLGSKGLTQPPNNQGPNIDTLYDCTDLAGAQFDKMPCVTMPDPGGSYYSAAPRSLHDGGVNVAYVDGHINFVVNEIDEQTMAYLIAIDDGQILNYAY